VFPLYVTKFQFTGVVLPVSKPGFAIRLVSAEAVVVVVGVEVCAGVGVGVGVDVVACVAVGVGVGVDVVVDTGVVSGTVNDTSSTQKVP
jgi:hypothetical protein